MHLVWNFIIIIVSQTSIWCDREEMSGSPMWADRHPATVMAEANVYHLETHSTVKNYSLMCDQMVLVFFK